MARQKPKKMSLVDWIVATGPDKVAKRLGLHENTVLCWRRRHGLPTTKVMRKIKKITRGAIGYDQIIDG
jgi:hypothetical protein